MKALIKVGYGCNENCTFCHTADLRPMEDTAERVAWKIERASRLGYSMVVLSGGEPTLRPELLAWARRVAALGMDFGLVTNGLLLSYPHVVNELVERCRLRYVYMSLHGGDAKVHRSVVRADTFERSLGAVRLLHGRVADLTVNCVVTTANVDHLRGLVDTLLPFDHLAVKLSMAEPKGAASHALDVIVPEVERCAARIAEAIEHGVRARGTREGPRFAHDGVPLCLLPGLEGLYDDLKTHRFAAMTEADEDDFVPVDDLAKIHPEEACGACARKGPCPGLYRGYFDLHGASSLRPVTGVVRSNSYHFVPERDVLRPAGAPCPIERDGTGPYDRGRTLFLRLRDRMRLFRTETRDFTDAELLNVKERLGQLYVDVSKKLAPDDFARDLRQIRPSAECTACAKRPACTGAWEPIPVDVFTRDDARVLAILGELHGRVLDVGCGEGRYLGAVAARAIECELEYVGLDPDEGRLRELGSKYPFARFVVGSAEQVGDELGIFDHALVLRSYNHLADPARALDRVLSLVRAGGTFTLVDNVAFGLVRGAAHAERAERAQANRFEHYRNDGATEAARRLEGRPLRLLERRDVGPGTSNQWLLRYEVL